MNVVMYTRTSPPCPHCMQAKSFAESKQIEYTNINIGTDITTEKFLELYPTTRTVPLILVDGNIVGGCTEFKNYILNKELGELNL